MKIFPISTSNICKPIKQNQSFTGVTREVSKEYVGMGDFGGGQGDYVEYLKTIEYRPFADETPKEIERNIKKLERTDMYTPDSYTYPSGYKVYPTSDLINTRVVVGEPLHCTKEEARLVIEENEKNPL